MYYYHKLLPLENAQNELIGKKLADIYGLICPRYFIAPCNSNAKEVTIYSEDLASFGKFTLPVFPSDLTTLYDIWDNLDFKKYDTLKLMIEIIKMYLFDLVLGNFDRCPCNWGLLENNGDVRLTIFDNEHLFSDEWSAYITSDFDDVKYAAGYSEKMVWEMRYSDLENFLLESDSRFYVLLEELLNLFTPEAFIKILDEVEEECGLPIVNKKMKIAFFNTNLNKTKELYSKYKVERK